MNQTKAHIEDDSIDLVALLKSLWIARKFIIKWTSGFVVVGVTVALLSSTSYTASTTFIPQTSSSDGPSSSLSGLASLAGINLSGVISGGEIPPSLYPQLLEAVPVKREILAIQVPAEEGMLSYGNYLSEAPSSTISQIQKYTIGLPFTILKALRGNEDSTTEKEFETILVSEEEKELFEVLENNIELSVNDQEGFVDLSITDADAVVATVLTKNIKSILQEKIIAYKVQYAKEFLAFTQKQYKEKRNEYIALQNEVATSKDANKNIISQRYQSQFKLKEGELAVATSVYQELAKQLEQAKLQVARDTPIFSTLKPASVPTERSAPKRTLIVLIWGFLGVVFSAGFVLVKQPALEVWKEINAKK
jgi:uncharacterized protein involved in exopolysaccharide biosynthesis